MKTGNLSPIAIRRDLQQRSSGGFTMVELLISSTLMAVSLLSIGGLLVLVYANVAKSGRTTEGLAAARELLEDLQTVEYDDLVNLDGFDTDDPSSLPDDGPEREIARKWRYTLAQDGVGWTFTDAEKLRWAAEAQKGHTGGTTQGGTTQGGTTQGGTTQGGTTTNNSSAPRSALMTPKGGRGQIDITAQGASLTRISVEVEIPGLLNPIEISTLVTRTSS